MEVTAKAFFVENKNRFVASGKPNVTLGFKIIIDISHHRNLQYISPQINLEKLLSTI